MWLKNLAQGHWLRETLWHWDGSSVPRVGCFVPPVFLAYARLLHPAYDRKWSRVRWSTIARWSGATPHEESAFDVVGRSPEEAVESRPWEEDPAGGTLPAEECTILAGVLEEFTTTPEASWYAFWRGFNYPDYPPAGWPVLELTERTYVVQSGSVSAAPSIRVGEGYQSANIWWPADHAWCVSTEIDCRYTLIGGNEELIRTIEGRSDLEVIRNRAETRVIPDR